MTLARWAAVVVGLVLVVSGAAKAMSPQWPTQVVQLGAPRWVIRVVPVAELGLGALLVVGLAEPWAAVGATALLISFTVLLALRLAQGRRPVCACFGPLSRRPISWWSVVRNLALIALALTAASS